ncbi:MAG: thiamine diphosphokinase [Acutalibacteraceae bacterium]|nr:thiamine diphosphokinase [Acutalibacteraceae bacterium]
MNRCFIFGASEITSYPIMPDSDDYIISADGGYETLKKLNISPDLILGDFDSLGYVPTGENVVLHPVEKDCTDMELAFIEGHKKGFREFYLYGGVGGERLDHTIANIQLISRFALNDASAFLLGEGKVITALHNRDIIFDKNASGIISVFCIGEDAKKVSIENLKYPLKDSTLSSFVPLGVSNGFTGKESKISVKDGTLILIFDEENLNKLKLPHRN